MADASTASEVRSPELTDEDIATLVEALDAWVIRRASGDLMGDLLCAVLVKDDEGQKSKFEAERLARRKKTEIETQLEKDTATLLKAKLIGIRHARLLGKASAA